MPLKPKHCQIAVVGLRVAGMSDLEAEIIRLRDLLAHIRPTQPHEPKGEHMDSRQILVLCKSLARRYSSRNDFNDIVSEGILAAYEALEEGKISSRQVTGACRRAMNDYVNHGSKLVKVPSNGANRDLSDDSDGRDLSALFAMRNNVVSEDEITLTTPSASVAYEKAEYEAYVMSVAVTCLTAREMSILKELFFVGRSKTDLSEKYEVSSQTIADWEEKILDKLRGNL